MVIQQVKNGERIISYASRSLTTIEQNYPQIERKAGALFWAVERFRMYLFGTEFLLVTDYMPLEYLFNTRLKQHL